MEDPCSAVAAAARGSDVENFLDKRLQVLDRKLRQHLRLDLIDAAQLRQRN